MPDVTFFDMFAGIGGFRSGLERAGGFRCIGHCEIDPHADKSYRAIHKINPKEVFYQDAKNIDPDKMPDFNVLCAGFPCRVSLSQGSAEASRMQEALSSLTSRASLRPGTQSFSYLKMFPDCYLMTGAGRLTPSSVRYQTWVTVWSGRCLTARISESRSPARGCTLSDILIPNVPEKYFLSQKQLDKLLYRSSEAHKAAGSMTRAA